MPDTYAILHEPIGSGYIKVTARPGPDGKWLVEFIRGDSRRKFLNQWAAWLPCGEWDGRRWLPYRSQHVPPDALAKVQDWLRGRPAVGVAS
jgi:hypothetical protein